MPAATRHIRLLAGLVTLLLSLQSCQSDFSSRESRENTWFYFRDSTEYRGELIGLIGDSVVADPISPDAATNTFHYRELESIVFFNDASPLANGVGGLLGGALLGLVGGIALGSAADANFDHGGPQIIAAEHSAGWGALAGAIVGPPIGALIGLIAGIAYSTNLVIYVDDRTALHDLRKLARYDYEDGVRRYRGY